MTTNVYELVNGTNDVVNIVVSTMPSYSLINDICQGLIALVAVIGAIAALCKRRSETPKLKMNFDGSDLHCRIEDEEIEGGVASTKRRRILMLVGVENVGTVSANGCKVIMDEAMIVSNDKYERASNSPTPSRYLTLIDDDTCEKRDYLGSGETVYFKLGYICAEQGSRHEFEEDVAHDSKLACIELHSAKNKPERFLQHQSHINIPLKLCCEGSSPNEYHIEINWKGSSVDAIGTAGSLIATIKSGRIKEVK